MNNEDYNRMILDSDIYRDLVKRHQDITHAEEMQVNYLEGVRDGMIIAINEFYGGRLKDKDCIGCRYIDISCRDLPCVMCRNTRRNLFEGE